MADGDGGWDLSALVEVLTRGEDRVRQLGACIDEHSPPEQRKQLVLQVQDSFRQAISMAKALESDDRLLRQPATEDSPRSHSGRSDNSHLDRASKEQERQEMCKKRKTLRKWTSQVRVALDGGGGAASDCLDDGYSWRKYGQKDILGAKHPRAYFRCTHRNTAGCLAIKQVQRSDDDPSVFDVTYRGEHICSSRKPQETPSSDGGAPSLRRRRGADNGLLQSFQKSLKVKTDGSSFEEGDRNSPFSFPSTPVSGSFMSENNLFSPPPFVSPATPEPSYNFSLSPWRMSGGETADLADVVSAAAATWASGSSAMDAAAPWGDPPLPFDYLENLPWPVNNK